jgi:hypothetical protein
MYHRHKLWILFIVEWFKGKPVSELPQYARVTSAFVISNPCILLFILSCIRIVTCRRVRVTIMTGSNSDDWIYWHFGYKFS